MSTRSTRADDDRSAGDEADLGNRSRAAELLPLMDALEREKRAIWQNLEPTLARAIDAYGRRAYGDAAKAYDEIAETFRRAHFSGEAFTWERRAAECRKHARRLARRKGEPK